MVASHLLICSSHQESRRHQSVAARAKELMSIKKEFSRRSHHSWRENSAHNCVPGRVQHNPLRFCAFLPPSLACPARAGHAPELLGASSGSSSPACHCGCSQLLLGCRRRRPQDKKPPASFFGLSTPGLGATSMWSSAPPMSTFRASITPPTLQRSQQRGRRSIS